MAQGHSRKQLEFYVVVIVIALISLSAVDRYSVMAKDARVLRLEIISHQFMTAAANLRIEYLISRTANTSASGNSLLVEGKRLYVSPQGWPISLSTLTGNDYRPSDDDCYQLWQLLFINPAPISVGKYTSTDKKYRVFAHTDACRYELAEGDAYFDYFPVIGKILFFGNNN